MTTQPALAPQRSTTKVVLKNFVWRGFDFAVSILGAVATTAAMARIIGPQRLGYFNFVFWVTSISATLGSVGVPAATQKYMAEYLGRGETGNARAIYCYALRLQTVLALVITVAGLAVVLAAADPHYRAICIFLVLSMIPQILAAIPAMRSAVD